MNVDLNLLRFFLAVAKTHSFRAAADELGVTRSAVSQGIRRLEVGLVLVLVQRTTRSVRLTEAGVRLHEQVSESVSVIGSALEEVAFDKRPSGLLRVAVTSIAECFLSGPLITSFAEKYPGITLDVTVTDDESDIVAAGFDAGVRLGEVIEKDMVAVPMTGQLRQSVVASPAYLARHGRPKHPRALINHRCIGWRPAIEVAPYRWEFREKGRDFDLAVDPHITSNDMLLMVRTALAGGGITIGMEDTFSPYVARGELVPLLQEFLPQFPGFYLYFPNRRNQPPKLRALVEHARTFLTPTR